MSFPVKTSHNLSRSSPGGNSVLSYLDIATPEKAEPGFLADSLRFFEHYVREGQFSAVFSSRRIAMRFGIIIGLQKLAFAEFRRLRARALQLLGDTSESKVRQFVARATSPLRVIVTRDHAGEVYQLNPESAARVAAVRPEFGPAVRIRVSDDTKSDFQALVSDFYPHIVMSLTGLSLAQLGQLGGAEVIKSNHRVWQMPPPATSPARCSASGFAKVNRSRDLSRPRLAGSCRDRARNSEPINSSLSI
jgi:hypothetical protein